MPGKFSSVFFDAHPLPSWLCEPKTLKVLNVNRAAIQQLGFSKNQWLKASLNERARGFDSLKNKSRIPATFVSKNGTIVPVILSVSVIAFRKHKVLYVSSFPAEQNQDKTTNFQYLFENNPLPMWIYDVETLQFLEVNRTAELKYGYSKQDFRSKTLLDIRPAEDSKRLIDVHANLPEYSQSGNWRHTLKNGKIIDVEVFSHSIEHNGKKARLVMANDISERKKAEEEIKKLATIVSRTSNAVVITDTDGNINWVNDGFERITGYTLHEVIGKKPGSFLQGHDTDKDTVAKMRKALKNNEAFKVEILNYAKSGRTYWVDIEAMPLKNARNVITGYIAIESDITVLKNTVQEMFKSQTLLQTIMDKAPLIVFVKDLKGQYTFFNNSFKKFYPGKYDKKILTDYDLFTSDQARTFRDSDNLAVQSGKTLEFEQDVVSNGKSESFYTVKFPLLDANDKPFAVGGLSMRITERKQTERLLKESREMLEKQNHVLEIINQTQEQFINNVKPSFFFASTLKNILLYTDSKIGFIGEIVFDNGYSFLEVHAIETLQRQPDGWRDNIQIQVQETLLKKIIHKGEPFIFSDSVDIKSITLTGIDFPIKTFLGIPIFKGSHKVGIIAVANRLEGYDLAMIKEIQPLTGVLGSIIEAVRNDQHRREAEHSLRESEQRFRAMADSAPVLIWMSGTDKLCTYFNKSWLDFTGRSFDQEAGNGWAEGVYPDDLDYCVSVYETKFDQREPFCMEYRLRRFDGEYRWMVDNGSPRYLSSGEFVGYIGTCTDIHERKLAEQSLIESEARYKSIVNDQQEMICRYVKGGVLTFVNKSYANTFGLEESALIGKNFSDFVHDDETRGEVESCLEKIFCNDSKVTSMEHNVIANGKKRWQQWMHIPIKNSSGRIYEVQAIGKDITRSKALQAEQDRLNKIVHESYNEIYLFHWDTFALEFVNDAAMTNLGYTEKEIKKLCFSNLFNYPDEMALSALLNPLRRGETDRVQIQIKFSRKNDTYYDGETLIQVLEKDRSFVAINSDITQKLVTEKKLLASILEKETLLKEIHHRVKNNLQLISSIIYIKMASLKEPELKYFLESTRQRIRSIALIHERLLQTEQLNKIEIADYLGKLIYDLHASNARQDLVFEIKTNLEHHTLDIDAAIYCGLIVNELITNSIKHAFQQKGNGVIEVEFKAKQNNFMLSVSDNGRTLPPDVVPGQSGSFGMHLLEILIRQLRGQLEVIRKNGTTFVIHFEN